MLLRRALESIHPIQVTSTCCETNVRWVHRRVSRTIRAIGACLRTIGAVRPAANLVALCLFVGCKA